MSHSFPVRTIDLNCDLGEGAGHDAEIMPWITSANIACGGHAGDEKTMRATVKLALRHGVAVGAHPGYPDRENFGRLERTISPSAAAAMIAGQIQALQKIAAEQGASLRHVKLHGALYNQAARDPGLATAIASAVQTIDPKLIFFGLAGSELLIAGRAQGLAVASEVFADRTYRSSGSLTPRSQPDALIADESASIAQVLQMAREGTVRATTGEFISVTADTVCLHGDGPNPVAFARRLRADLATAGIEVQAPANDSMRL
jgi:UPF0271 protein